MASLFGRITGMFRRSTPIQRNDRLLEKATRKGGGGPGSRRDAWQNILTKIGQSGSDKRLGGHFVVEPVTDHEARDLWRGDDIAKRVIEVPPRDAMRRGYSVKLDEKEKSEKLHARLEEMSVNRWFVRAGQFERAYGGAAIFPILNDSASSLRDELNEDKITKIRALHLFEPRQLQPVEWYDDPLEPKFGQVRIWRLVPIGTRGGPFMGAEIHESRLVIFPGIRVSIDQPAGATNGWGDNILTVINHVLRDYNLSWAAAIILLQDMSQGVFKMDGLAELIANDRDDEVERRMMILDLMRSIMRSLVIDKNDDYTRVTTPMSGFADTLESFCIRLAAAADMSVTKLMGRSPAGMNATGESDITQDDDRIIAWQDEHQPQLQQLVRLFMLEKEGALKGKEPNEWSIEFNPLRQPTEKEVAELRKLHAETDAQNIENQIYTAEDAARSRYGGDTYGNDIQIDWDERETQMEALAQASAEAMEMQAAVLASANAPTSASSAPDLPAANGVAGVGGNVQTAAFNGAQVTAMADLVKMAIAGEIPRESAIAIITVAFPVTSEQASAMMGPPGFKPTTPTPTGPFGGGAPANEPDPDGAPTFDARGKRRAA